MRFTRRLEARIFAHEATRPRAVSAVTHHVSTRAQFGIARMIDFGRGERSGDASNFRRSAFFIGSARQRRRMAEHRMRRGFFCSRVDPEERGQGWPRSAVRGVARILVGGCDLTGLVGVLVVSGVGGGGWLWGGLIACDGRALRVKSGNDRWNDPSDSSDSACGC
jgi:hypothetical protein